MQLFFIAAFIGFLVATPIFIPKAQEFLRQRKRLRLGLLIALPTLIFLLVMSLNIFFGIGIGMFYGCMQSNPIEERWNYSICDDDGVRSQFHREYFFQMMFPPMLRTDEICLTVEAGSFCESIDIPREWEQYISGLSVPFTAGLTCFGVLWFFSRDRRKAKRGGEITP